MPRQSLLKYFAIVFIPILNYFEYVTVTIDH